MNTHHVIVGKFASEYTMECWTHEGKQFSLQTDNTTAIACVIHMWVDLHMCEAMIETELQSIL